MAGSRNSNFSSQSTSPVTLTSFPFEDQLAASYDNDSGAFNKLLQKVKKSWGGIGTSTGNNNNNNNNNNNDFAYPSSSSHDGPLLRPWAGPPQTITSTTTTSAATASSALNTDNVLTGNIQPFAASYDPKSNKTRSVSAAGSSSTAPAPTSLPSKPAAAPASAATTVGLSQGTANAKQKSTTRTATDSLLSLATSHGVLNQQAPSPILQSSPSVRLYPDVSPPSAHPSPYAPPYASSVLSQSMTDLSSSKLQDIGPIPGFPIQDDDTRSVSSFRGNSVSHIFRRIQGEGLTKEYWMADESSNECYDCNIPFTTWRRKHHCRICGQIFCSRCASNLIPGERFGVSGVVRVCNLCLLIMERSYNRSSSDPDSAPPTPAEPSSSNVIISEPLENKIQPPQSQFAASTLFARPDPQSHHNQQNLWDPYWDSDSRIDRSRSSTPANVYWSRRRARSHSSPLLSQDIDSPRSSVDLGSTGAPFRKTSYDEDRPSAPFMRPTLRIQTSTDSDAPSPPLPPSLLPQHLQQDQQQPTPPEFDDHVPDSSDLTLQHNQTSHISTPINVPSSSVGDSTISPPAEANNNHQSNDSFSRLSHTKLFPRLEYDLFPPTDDHSSTMSPIVSSSDPNTFSRLLSSSQRSRRESFSSDVELNGLAYQHARVILKQYLKRERIPKAQLWEDCLLGLLTKVGQYPFPNVKNGDHMDVRNYIHVKKIPGATPRSCEFVNGVVCTKNVLHKRMPRYLYNPRIMLLSFPIEYQRVENQLMSLEPLIKQEREYLGNLVSRIVSQRPHIVLVEKNVSGLALEFLVEANVAVARNVKPSVIQAIHRSTQADIISSMDKLVEPRLGRCRVFKIESFNHPLIPGKRKTFLRFEGCSKELGGTIILRGGNMNTLQKIKKIMDTMNLIVFSLRLETALLNDERVIAQPSEEDNIDNQAKYIDYSSNDPSPLDGLKLIKSGPRLLPLPLGDQNNVNRNTDSANNNNSMNISDNSAKSNNDASTDVDQSKNTNNNKNRLPGSLASIIRRPSIDENVRYGQLTHEQQEHFTKIITAAYNAYTSVAISSSPSIKFPPPYCVSHMMEIDQKLNNLRRQYETQEALQIYREEMSAARRASSSVHSDAGSIASELSDSLSTTSSTAMTPALFLRNSPLMAPATTSISSTMAPLPGPAIPITSSQQHQQPDITPSATVSTGTSSSTSTANPIPMQQQQQQQQQQQRQQDIQLVKPKPFVPPIGSDSETEVLTTEAMNRDIASQQSTETMASPVSLPDNHLLKNFVDNDDGQDDSEQKQIHSTLAAEIEEVSEEYANGIKALDMHLARNHDSLDPCDHQNIIIMESTLNSISLKPCEGPILRRINYYGSGDCTLGQYLEDIVNNSGQMCTQKGCSVLNLAHYKSYVHRNFRCQIVAEQFPCPYPNMKDRLLMRSYCKICDDEPTRYNTVGRETWSFSFGKYLELSFYHDGLFYRSPDCTHNAHRDYVRYFAYKNLAVRIHIDEVDVDYVVLPTPQVIVGTETQKSLRAREYEATKTKITKYWDSVINRIRTIDSDNVNLESHSSFKAILSDLNRKAEHARRKSLLSLEEVHNDSDTMDSLALNPVLRSLQDKVVEWDNEFAQLEQKWTPSEKEVRSLTNVQLKRLFSDSISVPPSPFLQPQQPQQTSYFPTQYSEKEGDSDVTTAPSESVPSTPLKNELEVGATSKSNIASPQLEAIPSSSASIVSDTSYSASASETGDSNVSVDDDKHGINEEGQDDYNDDGNKSDSTINAADKASIIGTSPTTGKVLSTPEHEDPSPSTTNVAGLVKKFDQSSQENLRSRLPIEKSGIPRPVQNAASAAEGSVNNNIITNDDNDTSGGKNKRASISKSTSETSIPAKHPVRSASNLAKPTLSKKDGASTVLPTPRVLRNQPHRPQSPDSGNRKISVSRKASHLSPLTLPKPALSPSHTPITTPRTGKLAHKDKMTDSSTPSASNSAQQQQQQQQHSRRQKMSRYPSSRGEIPAWNSRSASGLTPPVRAASAATGKRSSSQTGGRVSTIARHFDRLSKEAERDRQKRMALMRGRRARPVTVAKPVIQVFDNVKDAVSEDSDESSSSDDSLSEDEYQSTINNNNKRRPQHEKHNVPLKESGETKRPLQEEFKQEFHQEARSQRGGAHNEDTSTTSATQAVTQPLDHEDVRPSVPEKQDSTDSNKKEVQHIPSDKDHELPTLSQFTESQAGVTGEKQSLMKTLSNLWAFRGPEWKPLEYPISHTEHVFANNSVIIREEEPSSVIAFTLSSKAYKDKLKEIDASSLASYSIEAQEAFMPDESMVNVGDRSSTWDLIEMPSFNPQHNNESEDTPQKASTTHLRFQFEEGSNKFTCKTFYTSEFEQLRRKCGCEKQFIHSLARCVRWDATGGKSGSAFFKTADDRFVVKEISRYEMDALLKFAPLYFDYVSTSMSRETPTVLAKIFGFYRISIRNSGSGKTVRDVLVQENLFYGRPVDRIYDLKGSLRNRFIEDTESARVLLDENFIKDCYKSPIYLHEQAKRTLRASLDNDTKFLSSMNVMDYSLIVGVNKSKKRLVVGIIDWVRQYTWDKRLESWVKDTGLLGGGGKGEPTIVTPASYMNRFRTAIENYFLLSPDIWTDENELKINKETQRAPRSH